MYLKENMYNEIDKTQKIIFIEIKFTFHEPKHPPLLTTILQLNGHKQNGKIYKLIIYIVRYMIRIVLLKDIV